MGAGSNLPRTFFSPVLNLLLSESTQIIILIYNLPNSSQVYVIDEYAQQLTIVFQFSA